jgi:hypothetical protein
MSQLSQGLHCGIIGINPPIIALAYTVKLVSI